MTTKELIKYLKKMLEAKDRTVLLATEEGLSQLVGVEVTEDDKKVILYSAETEDFLRIGDTNEVE